MDLSLAGPGATAAAAPSMGSMQQQQQRVFEVPVGVGFVDPTLQQQHDGRLSYDAADMQAMYGHQFNQHSMPSALLGRKHAPDRRPLRFWQPFNDWWRSELTRLGRRPTSEEIGEWCVTRHSLAWTVWTAAAAAHNHHSPAACSAVAKLPFANQQSARLILLEWEPAPAQPCMAQYG